MCDTAHARCVMFKFQCVAVCCSVLTISMSRIDLRCISHDMAHACCVTCLYMNMCGSRLDLMCDILNVNTLQHTATHCNTLQLKHVFHFRILPPSTVATHIATHCSTLQHTAAHCNTLQHTATHCNTLQHIAVHDNTLQHTTTHCSTLLHAATHCNILQHTITPCNYHLTLHTHLYSCTSSGATHTTTHCN